MKIRTFFLCGAAALALAGGASAGTELSDGFNGPTLSSPGAVGHGFNVVGSASVSGGVATVGGVSGPLDQNIYSIDTFDPTNTTLTWQVTSRPQIGAAGVMVGWDKSGIDACAGCGPEIWLEARDDRTVFDIVDNNGLARYFSSGPIGGTGPLTMSLTLKAATWSFNITDGSNSIASSGAYAPGFGISDVLAATGGNLSTFASVRSDCPGCRDSGGFDSVTAVAIPEPAAWSLMIAGFGLAGAALRRRRTAVTA